MTRIFTAAQIVLGLSLVLPQLTSASVNTTVSTAIPAPAVVSPAVVAPAVAAPASESIWGTQGDVTKSRRVMLEEAGYANGLARPMIKGAQFGKGGSSVCWLHVPEANDWVLANLNHTIPESKLIPAGKCLIEPGVLSYVNCYPLHPKNALPAGLFFWYNDWQDAGEPALGESGTFPVRTFTGKEAYVWDDTVKTYVNQITKEPYVTRGNRHPDDRAVRRWIYHDIVDLNKAFEYVMCMSEEQFRKKLAVTTKRSHIKKKLKPFNEIVKTLPEHTQKLFPDGFENNFKALPVSALRESYRARAPTGNPKNGRLFIIKKSELDKQRKGYIVDIRYVQSHFPGSVFQIGSTFGSTEKGAGEYLRDLNDMNVRPTQGDNAALGTIVGAIVRRYVVNPPDRNLLYGLRDIIQGANNSGMPYVGPLVNNLSVEQLIKASSLHDISVEQLIETSILPDVSRDVIHKRVFELALSGAIRVGVHKDVPVTSGSWGNHDISIPLSQELFDGPQARRVPAFNKRSEFPHSIHQVYTSAISMNPMLLKNPSLRALVEQEQFAMPRAALRAVYEGTILAAAQLLPAGGISPEHPLESITDVLNVKKKHQRLFLTLIGIGDSANPPEWIVTVLEQLQALMYVSGLSISLVVWDDTKMAPLLERLEAISKRMKRGNLLELSQAAEQAGELLWLFDADGKIKPKIEKESAAMVMPIKKNDVSLTLPLWRAAL